MSTKIKQVDFAFQHSLVKIVINRNCPEIRLVGLNVGPFTEGDELEVQFWIARELEKAGIARFCEEILDLPQLFKIQWKERTQKAGQPSRVPEDFYPSLRRFIKAKYTEVIKHPNKAREYEKIKQLTQDIVNARLKKIVSLASAPTQIQQMLKNFSKEERFLYEQLYGLICEWRTNLLEYAES